MPVIDTADSTITKSLSESERKLGVDLKLTADGDLEFNNLNDIKLIAGGANAAQAIRIKLEVEPGGLLFHPNIGTDLQIGSKVKDAFTIKTQILRSMIQDPRFSNVDVDVKVLDDVVIVDLKVRIADTDMDVPMQFTIPT